MKAIPPWIKTDARVTEALEAGVPVVALESTLITHGLPYPRNLEVARRIEEEVASVGAQPATIGVLHGQVRLGMVASELEQLAQVEDVQIIIRRDLAATVAAGRSGGTTVATTMIVLRPKLPSLLRTGEAIVLLTATIDLRNWCDR